LTGHSCPKQQVKIEGRVIDEQLKSELSRQGIFATSLQELYNWGRKSSLWPLNFGLACCAIEMIATTMARYDLARFGLRRARLT
jgi:NADH-quinone oxidoreductase subunit B